MLKRTALSGLGLVLLVSPLLVSAQSISDLQAQINVLLAQLQALQQQQANPTSSPLPSPVPPREPGDYDEAGTSSTCIDLQYNLKYRMTDARTEGEVSLLQRFLRAEGYLKPGPSGFFGVYTEMAVKVFQAGSDIVSYGSPATTGYGAVGPKTRAKIKEAICSSAAPIASSPTINPITPITPSSSIPSPVIAPVAPTSPTLQPPTVPYPTTTVPTPSPRPPQLTSPTPPAPVTAPTLATKSVPWAVAANNESRDYTWSESYTLLSLVLDAERTNDTSYLAEAHDRILAVVGGRDDRRGVFSRKPSWSFTDLTSGSCPVADPGTDAMVLYPMTRYLLALKKLALEGDAKWDFVTIRDAVTESVRGHRINWNTNGYRSPADAKDCYLDSARRKMYDFGLEPFNLDAAMGSVHANLYALTGNLEDRDKAAVIAQQLASQITKLPDGAWVWPYWRASPEPEDTGHAYIELDFIDQAYEAGIAFTFSDLAAITKTLALKVFPASGGMASFVSGEGLGNGDESLAGMYLPFSSTDSNLMGRITAAHDRAKAKTSLAGYGLLTRSYAARVENRPYGAACRVDDQCVTGSCFAGKVCGYPLGSSSTCYKHSDCASGLCAEFSGGTGRCIDRPAAQASGTSAPTLTFTANPSEIQSGGRTTVSWSTTNATSCTPIPGTSGAITGEVSYTLTENTTFPMACTGPGGSVSKNITVTVSQVQPTKLADGVECSSYDQCQSNYCYAGPENKKYCVNRDLNCAQPGTKGVTFGSTYTYNGSQYLCNTDSSVTRSLLSDGVECSSYDQCQSNYCYPGPENKNYCVNRNMQCAQPGSPGVLFGASYQYNGSQYLCNTDSSVTRGLISDGLECNSYDQCQSNYCYAGPENKKYCVNRDLNCAQPGTVGVTFGSTYTYNGSQYRCNTDSSVTKVSSSGTETNLASAVAALVQRQPAQSTPSKFTYTFTLDLWRGQSGTEVRALQEALKVEGLFNSEISGNFYDHTREGVLAFQTKYGINPTGYVGPMTRAQLNELY